MADSWLVYNRLGEGCNVVPMRDYMHEDPGAYCIALQTSSGTKYAKAKNNSWRATGLRLRAGNETNYVRTTGNDEIIDILGTITYCDRTQNLWDVTGSPSIDKSVYRFAPSSLYMPYNANLRMTFPRLPDYAILYIRFWFRLEEFRSDSNILVCTGGHDFEISVTRAGIVAYWFNGNANGCSNSPIQTGTWYHLAVRMVNKTAAFWLNGSTIASGIPWGGYTNSNFYISYPYSSYSSNMHIQKLQVFVGISDAGTARAVPEFQDNVRQCIIDAQFNQYYCTPQGGEWTVHGYPSILPWNRVDVQRSWSGQNGRVLYTPTTSDYISHTLPSTLASSASSCIMGAHQKGTSNWFAVFYARDSNNEARVGWAAEHYWDSMSPVNNSGVGYCQF